MKYNKIYIIENLSKTFSFVLLNCYTHVHAMAIKEKVEKWYETFLLERMHHYDIGFADEDLELVLKVYNGNPKELLEKYPLNFLMVDNIDDNIFNDKFLYEDIKEKLRKIYGKGEKNE